MLQPEYSFAININISIPNKYFDTYPGMPEGDNTFISPGIGFIKREYFGTDSSGNSFPEEIYTLVDYKLNYIN